MYKYDPPQASSPRVLDGMIQKLQQREELCVLWFLNGNLRDYKLTDGFSSLLMSDEKPLQDRSMNVFTITLIHHIDVRPVCVLYVCVDMSPYPQISGP